LKRAQTPAGDAAPAPPSALAASRSLPVFDRLYATSKLTAAELDAARLAYAAAQLAECTFQPSTERSKRSAQMMGLRTVEGSSPEAAELPDTFSRLYKDATERSLKKSKAVEEARETQACPFSPEISEVSRRITESMRDAATGDLPRHLLLYEDGLQRQQVRLLPHLQTSESLVCNFQFIFCSSRILDCAGPKLGRGES
jgi:hypothetical protein